MTELLVGRQRDSPAVRAGEINEGLLPSTDLRAGTASAGVMNAVWSVAEPAVSAHPATSEAMQFWIRSLANEQGCTANCRHCSGREQAHQAADGQDAGAIWTVRER